MPALWLYSTTVPVQRACIASSATCGVAMSGWPMFRCSTFMPRFLAASAKGTSLRMGEAGIRRPFWEMEGMGAALGCEDRDQ